MAVEALLVVAVAYGSVFAVVVVAALPVVAAVVVVLVSDIEFCNP